MTKYSIKNNSLSISVNSLGAELCSFKSDLNTELLWQANPTKWNRSAPILFPIVGRQNNNLYYYNGESYLIPQHGFARDSEFVLIDQSNEKLQFELTANNETLKKFPFHFSLIVTYLLFESKLEVLYEVFNPSNTTLYFSIGAHPGFSTNRIKGESLHDFELEFEGKNSLVYEQLENGLLGNLDHQLYLNNNRLKLDEQLFDNDALVFKNNQIQKVKLISRKSKPDLQISCENWPYFGIWTKKKCEEFICLEPWHGVTDFVDSNQRIEQKEGIIALSLNNKFNTSYSIELV